MRALAVAAIVALAGCFSVDVPKGTVIKCASDADCPAHTTCVASISACVDPSIDKIDPTATVDVTPAAGRAGTRFDVTIVASEALALQPVASVAGEPALFVDESGLTYHFHFNATGAEPPGAAAVDVDLVDAHGRTGHASGGDFSLDFTPPVVDAITTSTTRVRATGAFDADTLADPDAVLAGAHLVGVDGAGARTVLGDLLASNACTSTPVTAPRDALAIACHVDLAGATTAGVASVAVSLDVDDAVQNRTSVDSAAVIVDDTAPVGTIAFQVGVDEVANIGATDSALVFVRPHFDADAASMCVKAALGAAPACADPDFVALSDFVVLALGDGSTPGSYSVAGSFKDAAGNTSAADVHVVELIPGGYGVDAFVIGLPGGQSATKIGDALTLTGTTRPNATVTAARFVTDNGALDVEDLAPASFHVDAAGHLTGQVVVGDLGAIDGRDIQVELALASGGLVSVPEKSRTTPVLYDVTPPPEPALSLVQLVETPSDVALDDDDANGTVEITGLASSASGALSVSILDDTGALLQSSAVDPQQGSFGPFDVADDASEAWTIVAVDEAGNTSATQVTLLSFAFQSVGLVLQPDGSHRFAIHAASNMPLAAAPQLEIATIDGDIVGAEDVTDDASCTLTASTGSASTVDCDFDVPAVIEDFGNDPHDRGNNPTNPLAQLLRGRPGAIVRLTATPVQEAGGLDSVGTSARAVDVDTLPPALQPSLVVLDQPGAGAHEVLHVLPGAASDDVTATDALHIVVTADFGARVLFDGAPHADGGLDDIDLGDNAIAGVTVTVFDSIGHSMRVARGIDRDGPGLSALSLRALQPSATDAFAFTLRDAHGVNDPQVDVPGGSASVSGGALVGDERSFSGTITAPSSAGVVDVVVTVSDVLGNTSVLHVPLFVDDLPPLPGPPIVGSSSDVWRGVVNDDVATASVSLALFDQTLGAFADASKVFQSPTPVFFPAAGAGDWSFAPFDFNLDFFHSYIVTVRAVDEAGNVSSDVNATVTQFQTGGHAAPPLTDVQVLGDGTLRVSAGIDPGGNFSCPIIVTEPGHGGRILGTIDTFSGTGVTDVTDVAAGDVQVSLLGFGVASPTQTVHVRRLVPARRAPSTFTQLEADAEGHGFFAVDDHNELLRSFDGGRTWLALAAHVRHFARSGHDVVISNSTVDAVSFARVSHDDGRTFAVLNGVFLDELTASEGVFYGSDFSIQRSDDRGMTWPGAQDIFFDQHAAKIVSANGAVIAFFQSDRFCFTCRSYRSVDGSAFDAPLSGLVPMGGSVSASGSTWALGNSFQPAIGSDDGGANWAPVNASGTPFVDGGRVAFFADPFVPGPNPTIAVSDAGVTGTYRVVHPGDASEDIRHVWGTGDHWYALGHALYASDDGAVTWREVGTTAAIGTEPRSLAGNSDVVVVRAPGFFGLMRHGDGALSDPTEARIDDAALSGIADPSGAVSAAAGAVVVDDAAAFDVSADLAPLPLASGALLTRPGIGVALLNGAVGVGDDRFGVPVATADGAMFALRFVVGPNCGDCNRPFDVSLRSSVDHGATFDDVGTDAPIADAEDDALVAGDTRLAIFAREEGAQRFPAIAVTADRGDTWTAFPFPEGTRLERIFFVGDVIYVAGADGSNRAVLSRLDESAGALVPVLSTNDFFPIASLTADASRLHMLATTLFSGPGFFSSDGGATFTRTVDLDGVDIAAVEAAQSGSDVFVRADDGTAYVSADDGLTFSPLAKAGIPFVDRAGRLRLGDFVLTP